MGLRKSWRRGWDLNPRYACTHAGFQDRCIQPLCHLSRCRNEGQWACRPTPSWLLQPNATFTTLFQGERSLFVKKISLGLMKSSKTDQKKPLPPPNQIYSTCFVEFSQQSRQTKKARHCAWPFQTIAQSMPGLLWKLVIHAFDVKVHTEQCADISCFAFFQPLSTILFGDRTSKGI